MAVVKLDHLTKRYDAISPPAVDDISLTIEDGEFMVLLGPSGCGKSTTLRMIAGLEGITEGELSMDDRIINNVAAKDRDIAMVFQSYALYPHMNVRDNMSFGLRRRGFDRAEITRRVADASAVLELTDYLDRKPYALSGGQRQRVALGRAIVRDPKVFLLDEPLSNLDAALRVSTRSELIKQHRRLGTTMIYVTHDQVEAMTMGTRICIMNGGRIAQVGRPIDVYRYPADTFVARFLGSPGMNLMAGEISQMDDGAVGVRIGSNVLPVPYAGKLPPGSTAVTVGVRPEDVYDHDRITAELVPHPVQATVSAVEPLGADTLVQVEFDGVKGEITARLGREVMAQPNDRIELLVDVRMIRIFDIETGKALVKEPHETTGAISS